ncbi:MAG: hypothetical protein CM1200mP41_34590 [Gammaproteobacteria bacterium]|nr:MAG: hypothetical protein CM1200mP41_34590 [Gammaproteobacteria bacterium]
MEAVSSCYRSAPIGFLEQPDFLNAVFRVATLLSPVRLLHCLQSIELRAASALDSEKRAAAD